MSAPRWPASSSKATTPTSGGTCTGMSEATGRNHLAREAPPPTTRRSPGAGHLQVLPWRAPPERDFGRPRRGGSTPPGRKRRRKSTLLHILAGVYPPNEGTIRLEGRDVRFAGAVEARRRRGHVFQNVAWPERSTSPRTSLRAAARRLGRHHRSPRAPRRDRSHPGRLGIDIRSDALVSTSLPPGRDGRDLEGALARRTGCSSWTSRRPRSRKPRPRRCFACLERLKERRAWDWSILAPHGGVSRLRIVSPPSRWRHQGTFCGPGDRGRSDRRMVGRELELLQGARVGTADVPPPWRSRTLARARCSRG